MDSNKGSVLPESATTAVVVLGASEWPFASQFESAQQFANSAHAFIRYVCAPNGLNLKESHLLDLFDSDDEQPVIVRKIADFLRQLNQDLRNSGQTLKDVITFYVGHGGFDTGSNSAYFLAIRKTNPVDYLGSSLSASSLRRALREHAGSARHYLILDCCFAAAAVATYIQMSAAAQGAIAQVQDNFPPTGTALLCAAGALIPAKAKRDAIYTIFSEGLLEVLTLGVTDGAERLTISDIGTAVRNVLRLRYADEEVHSPEQPKGSVADVPLFQNARAAIKDVGVSASARATSPQPDFTLQSSLPGSPEQFIREFEETDVPPNIAGMSLSHFEWGNIPLPVKTLLKEYERLFYRSKMVIFTSFMIFPLFINAVAFVIVSVTPPESKFLKAIGISVIIVSWVSAGIGTAWSGFWALQFFAGAKTEDRNVLRPFSGSSEDWERYVITRILREPRRLIIVPGWGRYLHRMVMPRLLMSLAITALSAVGWTILYFASH